MAERTPYEQGQHDAFISASIMVRTAGHDLLACDLEDQARKHTNPELCDHPYWNFKPDGGTICRTCGTDTSNIDPMGR